MKAIVKARPEFDGSELMEVPTPAPGPNDVLVKIRMASICGTDYHIYKWDAWSAERIKTPLIYGHEFCGEIAELGKNVTGLKKGDYVSGECHLWCGKCYQCKNGLRHICKNLKIFGVDSDGIFSEYAVIPAENIRLNIPELPPEIASIQDPFGNALHSVSATNVKGKNVAVMGMGPIGAICVSICKHMGAKKIFAIDKGNAFRLKIAKDVGADFALDANHDVLETIMQETDGNGVDAVLEMSGSSKAVSPALDMLTGGGDLILLGVYADPVALDLSDQVVFKYATIKGINGRRIFTDWDKMNELFRTTEIVSDLKKVITHKFKMEDFHQAMSAIKTGECCKVILEIA